MLKLIPLLLAGWLTTLSLRAADQPTGLALTVTVNGVSDRSVAENVWLYVPAGKPATPFVPAGALEARWEGFIASELRADYTFHAEATGEIKVALGDTVALEGSGTGATPLTGKSVRLNKGANPVTVTFKSPAGSDAFVRLFWSNAETPYNPVPFSAWTHASTDSLEASLKAREGRHLFAEHRCGKCHEAPGAMAELSMDAPNLTGIGSRRHFDWLAKWIADPAAMRPGTPMPALLHGPATQADAEAIATYLTSLKGTTKFSATTGDTGAGKDLYEKLHCTACHNAPDATEIDAKKISQKHVAAKFTPGALAAFLQKPEEHYAWIRMPNFKLNSAEAANLTAYLESAADKPSDRSAPTAVDIIEKGRKLVASTGCLNCHAVEGLKNEFSTKALAALPSDKWTSGCVAPKGSTGDKAPIYALSDTQRAALKAFASTDRSSLGRHVESDFLQRQSQALNCRECHGKFEGFPTWDLLPGKLKPEWASRFIGGAETRKPRPWLEPRMPLFPAYAHGLGVGLSTSAGLPPTSPEDGPADPQAAEKGRKLVSANGGFSCVSCHGAADFGATQVFEAPGINLALSHERLQRGFFNRWLRSPLSVDPTTKMPVYFDEQGKSPLTEIYDGDGPKTINSVWEYLRLKDTMPRPE